MAAVGKYVNIYLIQRRRVRQDSAYELGTLISSTDNIDNEAERAAVWVREQNRGRNPLRDGHYVVRVEDMPGASYPVKADEP